MFKKYTTKTWWGFETLEADCHCDFDNREIRKRQIFSSEKERDNKLKEWMEGSDFCIKECSLFCTNINEKVEQ